MKYLTLLIALSAGSIATAKSHVTDLATSSSLEWYKSLDFSATPLRKVQYLVVEGPTSGDYTLTNWNNVTGSTNTAPPWTSNFATLGYTTQDVLFHYDVPQSGIVNITLRYMLADGIDGGWEGWQNLPSTDEYFRVWTYKKYYFTGR